MKKCVMIALSLITAVSLMACSNSSGTKFNQKSAKQNQAATSSNENKTSKDTAVVYFSGTGNTKKVAEKLSEELPADIYEIEPAEVYTSDNLDYNNDSCRANREMDDESARPEIGSDLSAILNYENIYIGYPIWWGTRPRIIQTFLETYDLSGKTIYTFCTSGGSGIEQSVEDLKKDYPELNIAGGYRFTANADSAEIQKGIKKLGK